MMLKCLICFIYLYLYYMCLYFPPYLCCCICIVQKPSIIYILWCSSDSSYMSNSYLYLFCMHLYFSLRFLSYLCCWVCIVYNRSPETAKFNWIHRTSSVSYHWMRQLHCRIILSIYQCANFTVLSIPVLTSIVMFKCANCIINLPICVLSSIAMFKCGNCTVLYYVFTIFVVF